MDQPSRALTLQFLAYVAAAPRSYADVMAGWRSTCPRLSIWEDAVLDGLVRIEGRGRSDSAQVIVTAKGFAVLAQAAQSETGEPAPSRSA